MLAVKINLNKNSICWSDSIENEKLTNSTYPKFKKLYAGYGPLKMKNRLIQSRLIIRLSKTSQKVSLMIGLGPYNE